MYAISFDLDTRELAKHHPKSVNQAYRDIANTLKQYDFKWTQGSLYTTKNEDMANVSDAIDALGLFLGFHIPLEIFVHLGLKCGQILHHEQNE